MINISDIIYLFVKRSEASFGPLLNLFSPLVLRRRLNSWEKGNEEREAGWQEFQKCKVEPIRVHATGTVGHSNRHRTAHILLIEQHI